MFLLLIVVASAFLMKATELAYGKKPIQCWVAEAFEPYFSMEKPESQTYEIIPEYKIVTDSIDLTKCKKQVIYIFRSKFSFKFIDCVLIDCRHSFCRKVH